MTGLQSVAGVIGYSLGAGLFGYFITDRAPIYLPGASFFMSAILAFLAMLLAAAVLKKHAGEAGAGVAFLASATAPVAARSPDDPQGA